MEILTFNSWGEYLRHVSQEPDSPRKQSANGSSYFSDTDSYEQAMQLAGEGWHRAEEDARKITNALVRRVGALIERDEELYDVEGQGVDVAVFTQGLPESWVRFEQHYSEAPGPIVRIVFNAAASGGVTTSTIRAKGAAVAGLIECIELSGKSVELWMVLGVSSGWLSFELRVKVKEAGQPLDMGRVMFALAHPASLRRLGFRAIELSSVKELTSGGYGMPTEVAVDGDRGDLYIGMSYYGQPQWDNEQATIEWVVRTLRAQNVDVQDATIA